MWTARLDRDLVLTVCGIDELPEYSTAGVTHVLSFLDPDHPEPESFAAFDPHHRLTLRVDDIIDPRPPMVVPERHHVEQLVAFGHELDASGEAVKHLLIHCHAGVSRSTAALVTLLAEKTEPGEERQIFERLRRVRPQAWPNSRMVHFADDILQRDGRLDAALQEHYRIQSQQRPLFMDFLKSAGRAAEVPDD